MAASAQRIVVGSRVEVPSIGAGMVAMDNEDGTWNIEFDDGQEGDFPTGQFVLAANQSLKELRQLPDAAPTRELPSGIRVLSIPWSEPKPEGWTRFVCFSDTHGLHGSIPSEHQPEADVLLHAGDFSNTGELEQVESLSRWLQAYPAQEKVVIAGNHDTTFHEEYYMGGGGARFHDPPLDCAQAKALLQGCTYLEDTSTEVLGYKVYGSPWQPEFCDWAFSLRHGSELWQKWQEIPHDVDILLTHGPARGFCDRTSRDQRVGCPELAQAIRQRTVPVSVSGHIHDGYGWTTSVDESTLFINASTCNSSYSPTNPPIVFDAPPAEELRSRQNSQREAGGGRSPGEGGATSFPRAPPFNELV
uniref:Calcineurin-like phosphoesterase domain-containing protein n=1 Tax=Florenciella parvula TaxID=236787 RepID=A0A7S2CIW0_9STRA|mmetsp:Transcript_29467/g.60344  ORF Transcript_29467/g.60344 Transcript_29467/m.60344 type:complete len:360 (+) Transcript_29467:194-1273(+)|eukprot:CAMPEP_0182522718 /NCGR_PEP_ID=MMETSP1323-20130603/500_1 /TAXON_ID=236787 /ORGANISM="Florenciella parvula, Strain RCC1693" /LENGTH=359 /DNA_ID=CAMNT_0024730913 /DNA_START=194 /DNA_END=1273 /DNA_ORIENTATION=+